MKRNRVRIGLAAVLAVGVITGLAGCALFQLESPSASQPFIVPDDAVLYVKQGHIWVASSNGTSAQQLAAEHSQMEISPVWSPDHTQFYYVARPTNEFYELRQYTIRTAQTTTLFATRKQPSALQPSPNGTHLMYQEGENLYILDTATLERTRIHEGVRAAAWSFTGEQFVFSTNDNRLLLQDYTVQGEFSDPVTLQERAVSSPIFVKANTLAFETEWEGEYTAVTYDMQTEIMEPISSMRFTNLDPAGQLVLEPLGTRLFYVRTDDITELPNVWLIDLKQPEPQLILTNASHAIWAANSEAIYYVVEKADRNDKIIRTVYTATAAGLQKTELATAADSIVSQSAVKSNEPANF